MFLSLMEMIKHNAYQSNMRLYGTYLKTALMMFKIDKKNSQIKKILCRS